MLFLARLLGLAPGIVSMTVAVLIIVAVFAAAGQLDALVVAVERIFGSFNSLADAIGQGR